LRLGDLFGKELELFPSYFDELSLKVTLRYLRKYTTAYLGGMGGI